MRVTKELFSVEDALFVVTGFPTGHSDMDYVSFEYKKDNVNKEEGASYVYVNNIKIKEDRKKAIEDGEVEYNNRCKDELLNSKEKILFLLQEKGVIPLEGMKGISLCQAKIYEHPIVEGRRGNYPDTDTKKYTDKITFIKFITRKNPDVAVDNDKLMIRRSEIDQTALNNAAKSVFKEHFVSDICVLARLYGADGLKGFPKIDLSQKEFSKISNCLRVINPEVLMALLDALRHMVVEQSVDLKTALKERSAVEAFSKAIEQAPDHFLIALKESRLQEILECGDNYHSIIEAFKKGYKKGTQDKIVEQARQIQISRGIKHEWYS